MKNVNRVELVKRMAKMTGQSKAATDQALWAFMECVQEAVASGDKVTLVGFGVFELRDLPAKPARIGRNPQTGEAIELEAVPETVVPRFRPGQTFKDIARRSYEGVESDGRLD